MKVKLFYLSHMTALRTIINNRCSKNQRDNEPVHPNTLSENYYRETCQTTHVSQGSVRLVYIIKKARSVGIIVMFHPATLHIVFLSYKYTFYRLCVQIQQTGGIGFVRIQTYMVLLEGQWYCPLLSVRPSVCQMFFSRVLLEDDLRL